MDDSLGGLNLSLVLPRYLPAVRAPRPKVEGLTAELAPVDPVVVVRRPSCPAAAAAAAAGTAAAASVVASVSDAAV